MNTYGKIFLTLLLFGIGLAGFKLVNDGLNPGNSQILRVERKQQHIEAMEKGANPAIGITTVQNDGLVDENFESHLPLVVIDLNEQVIPVIKKFADDETIIQQEEDPFVNGVVSIIDNENCDNKISDKPTITSEMKIRYRGNYSLNLDKKQFAIKMLDENGNSKKVDVMGMGENNDWILNISQLDQSYMRNYMAYNLGSALFPFTPDCKYCEVIIKNGNSYEYHGLYLMMEKVEEGPDRVDIEDYNIGDKYVSYLVERDRKNDNIRQLSTYGDQNSLTYGRLEVIYPNEDIIDDYAFDYIQRDIDNVERILYSNDMEKINTWPEFLDEKSFVDYFIFNELFGNYDAGNNSTFMYKDKSGKIKMGPLWDYDMAMDNSPNEMSIPENVVFQNHPWFERLVMSKKFVKDIEDRSVELTNGLYSYDNLNKYIDDVSLFLGNAALRDRSRWSSVYGVNSNMQNLVDKDGYVVTRKTLTWNEEVDRLKNYFFLKEECLPKSLKSLEKYSVDKNYIEGGYATILILIILGCTTVIISRRNTFV